MGLEGGVGVKWLERGEIYSDEGCDQGEDARFLVETSDWANGDHATLA
jgi:hypothetical protein